MKFQNLLKLQSVLVDDTSRSKSAVLLKLSELMSSCYPELCQQKLFNAYWERESLGSTAIGHGIMIPHICLASINKTHACFIKLKHPVDFGAEDKQPIDLIFGLASATNSTDQHLQVLSQIVTEFANNNFVSECRNCKNANELYSVLTQETVDAL